MDAQASIGVLIVEDDPLTRQALADKVGDVPGLHVSAVCGSMAEARALIATCDAAVALTDLGLPDGDGTDLIRLAVARNPPMEVMVITVFGDERHVLRAIEAGATGYLLKDADADSVGESIRALLAGGSPISTSIARHLLRRFRRETPAPLEGAAHLTPREIEVLEVISRGYSNAEIGGLLSMSHHTVNTHIKSIYRKLTVRSRSEAVFEAVQQGLIHIERDPTG
jgi:DNA-binding NarL/FixJ family response regulator